MWRFEFISHDNISESILSQIIELKNRVWHYPYTSHKQWIDENLRSEDYHLLLWFGNNLIGYLNIVQLNGTTDAWGIGNVVISPDMQGRNIGYLLMKICDFFLVSTKKPGVLICKESVCGFYFKCGWKKFLGKVWFNSLEISNQILTRHFNNSQYPKLELDRIF